MPYGASGFTSYSNATTQGKSGTFSPVFGCPDSIFSFHVFWIRIHFPKYQQQRWSLLSMSIWWNIWLQGTQRIFQPKSWEASLSLIGKIGALLQSHLCPLSCFLSCFAFSFQLLCHSFFCWSLVFIFLTSWNEQLRANKFEIFAEDYLVSCQD